MDYASLLEDQLDANDSGISSELDQYIHILESVTASDYKKFSRNERLAFLINAYNAATIKLVVENMPLTSILKVEFDADTGKSFTFSHVKVIELLGKRRTLDNIENELIRESFKEPYMHTAVNCASHGCPSLLPEPYVGKQLEKPYSGDEKMTYLTVLSKQESNGYIEREIFVCTNAPVKGQEAAGTIFKILVKDPVESREYRSFAKAKGEQLERFISGGSKNLAHRLHSPKLLIEAKFMSDVGDEQKSQEKQLNLETRFG